MSPRRLTGWEPRQLTEYHYEDGVLIGATTTVEPEWCEADRLAVFAELQRRRMLGSHGQPMDEATDPRGNPSSHDAEWGYRAVLYSDFAKAAIDSESRAYREKYGELPDGAMWSVQKIMRV